MPFVETDSARLHYLDEGNPDGFCVLTIAPGGMRSAATLWESMPWNPRIRLADDYRVISMDQRNAGESRAPISAADSWATYTADQLAVVDHLGIDRFAVVGMCIGGPYVMGLIKAAPERVAAAIMLQPIGLDGNRDAFFEMFDTWAEAVGAEHPEADEATWNSFKQSMYGGDFLFNTTRDEVAACTTPLLVAMGNDRFHPQSTSREIAALAPDVVFIEQWKDDGHIEAADTAFRAFLAAKTAGSSGG